MTTRKPTQRKSLSQTKHDNATAMNYLARLSDQPLIEVPEVKRRAHKVSNPDKPDEPKEHAEQVAVIDWWFHYSRSIQLHPNLLVACPNAQMLIAHANNPNAALMYLRREGMRPGALDLTLYVARSPWHGLLIEMKRRTKGTVSPEQQAMADTIAGQGYRCILARGADDAIAQIKHYLRG
jgi:hypothetical protein